MLRKGSILTGWVCVKHKITLEIYGSKIPGMTLSRVLKSYIRHDRVVSNTVTFFIISHSESSTKLFFFISNCIAYCIVVCLCASPIFAFLQTVAKCRLVSRGRWGRATVFTVSRFFFTLLYMIFLYHINHKSTSNFAQYILDKGHAMTHKGNRKHNGNSASGQKWIMFNHPG